MFICIFPIVRIPTRDDQTESWDLFHDGTWQMSCQVYLLGTTQPQYSSKDIKSPYWMMWVVGNLRTFVVYPCLEIQLNCFCIGIFHESAPRMSEICLNKNNEPDFQTRIHHKLVIVFMLYYFCFDDINV